MSKTGLAERGSQFRSRVCKRSLPPSTSTQKMTEDSNCGSLHSLFQRAGHLDEDSSHRSVQDNKSTSAKQNDYDRGVAIYESCMDNTPFGSSSLHRIVFYINLSYTSQYMRILITFVLWAQRTLGRLRNRNYNLVFCARQW